MMLARLEPPILQAQSLLHWDVELLMQTRSLFCSRTRFDSNVGCWTGSEKNENVENRSPTIGSDSV